MERTATEAAIRVFIGEIRQRLSGAAAIAGAAETCVNAGQLDQAIQIALDIEEPAHEATRLLEAATILFRLSKTQDA